MKRRNILKLMSIGALITSFSSLLRHDFRGMKALAQPIKDANVPSNCDYQKIINNFVQETKKQKLDYLSPYRWFTDQDRKSAGSGIGITPCDGTRECLKPDERSEKTYLPFLIATRRQTDQMVRQAYALLPDDIRSKTAFIVCDRLAQKPEEYIDYINSRENVVLIGGFWGINNLDRAQYQANKDGKKDYNTLSLLQLQFAIDLTKNCLHKPIIDVVYSMGDSSSKYASELHEDLQKQIQNLLMKNGLENLAKIIQLGWGFDEMVVTAFARRLPNWKLKFVLENGKAQHHYDGNKSTQDIINSNQKILGFEQVQGNNFDAQVFVFDRYPGADYKFNTFSRNSLPKDMRQAKEDKSFLDKLKALPSNQHSKTIIIDGRNPNGALNTTSMPLSDQFLAFGSWGTFGNALGQTLAMAKILYFSTAESKAEIQRELLLEAVAHDIFIIGYEMAQADNSPLRKKLKNNQLPYTHKDPPYTYEEVQSVFPVINQHVNEQMSKQKQMTVSRDTKFIVIPQLWRTFESQVYISDGLLSSAGVYRKDLNSKIFDPTVSLKNIKQLKLDDIH